jgi:NAD(P)-dependent dehydrogenase (short-subunit alcohol dehydrogenase family)
MRDLEGKVAIVTGSSKGIGLAIAEGLANAGASVVLAARTPAGVAVAADRLSALAPDRILGVPCDVRDPMACASLVDRAVSHFGRLDVLVNNAGVGVIKPIGELSVEEWKLQIETNLGGVFYCSKAALPHLAATGDGWIINIGSLASRNPIAGGSAYNATKFGLLGMTEATMLDVRHSGVRVSIVMPGSVNTWFGGREPLDHRDWRIEPEDCALAVLQLLEFPREAHVSRIEMRPSRPRQGQA